MDYHRLLHNKEVVTERMNDLFLRDDFRISKSYLKEIHGYLFKDILPDSGSYRDYNIRRHEVIINEESVSYEDYHTIDTYLQMEMDRIKKIDFNSMTDDERIKHIIDIVTNIWTVHPFGDGNTRTITVFIQKYLASFGYQIDQEYFRKNSEYFRNAIVRAVYSNNEYGVTPDREPLFIFFSNVMHNDNERLKGDSLIVREMFDIKKNKGKVKKRMLNK